MAPKTHRFPRKNPNQTEKNPVEPNGATEKATENPGKDPRRIQPMKSLPERPWNQASKTKDALHSPRTILYCNLQYRVPPEKQPMTNKFTALRRETHFRSRWAPPDCERAQYLGGDPERSKGDPEAIQRHSLAITHPQRPWTLQKLHTRGCLKQQMPQQNGP